jgi:chromate transporter
MPAGSASEVFGAFLRLGLTSFGGPVAHLGYFRAEFVVRRGWLDEARYAQLLALCQFLPGPASSQMGFAIGLLRAGWRGALAAFLAFTAPAALLMFAFASLAPPDGSTPFRATLHGLKLVAVVVVAGGVLGMARTLAPDWPRRLIALATLALVLAVPSGGATLAAIALGALAGLIACRPAATATATDWPVTPSWRGPALCLALFATGLVLAAWLLRAPAAPGAAPSPALLAAAFYQPGALVFGGGHVVLPLLERTVVEPGWIDADPFLAGYGAAQAMPGPMFTFAAYLGALLPTGLPPAAGAALALVSIFVPGMLLLVAALPAWGLVGRSRPAAAAVAGVNAAVVGLLGAALYDPVWLEAVGSIGDVAIVATGLALQVALRRPALGVVLWCVSASLAAGPLARLVGS